MEALYNELKGNSSKIENKEVKNYIKDHGNGPHCDSFLIKKVNEKESKILFIELSNNPSRAMSEFIDKVKNTIGLVDIMIRNLTSLDLRSMNKEVILIVNESNVEIENNLRKLKGQLIKTLQPLGGINFYVEYC
ncbi:hypothetical protein [Thermocladium modestius]|uniref:hypothetical protein n=1 Tax=Thermocladium modestius TaxID=62609 RepID=UPI001669492E|nr:hypothetical protein [Thermocladium modestius]